MKILSLAFTVLTLLACAHAETKVSAVLEGKPVSLTASQASEIEKWSVVLLASCNYEAPREFATESRWATALENAHIQVVFAEPLKLSLRVSTQGPVKDETVWVTAMLIPASKKYPEYIFVRSEGAVRAFAKYRDYEAFLALKRSLPGWP